MKVTSLKYLQMQGKLCSTQSEVRMPKQRISQSDLSDHVISENSPHIGSISMTKIIIQVLSPVPPPTNLLKKTLMGELLPWQRKRAEKACHGTKTRRAHVFINRKQLDYATIHVTSRWISQNSSSVVMSTCLCRITAILFILAC